MPGVVGIISQRPLEQCGKLVKSMLSSMEHESFYDSDLYCVPEMGIYAGWVAHENSFASGQPFVNELNDVVLLLSGECFIDDEIRVKLRQKGHELGRAAGSWLVHLYEEEGEGFFEQLNGSFSGLLIDKRRKKAFLFNDRYGAERIYWHETKDATFFASEAKALLRVLPEVRKFDKEGVAQFLTFGCTLEQRTLFQGVQLLPGASVWCFENGRCKKRRYFSPEIWESQSVLSVDSFAGEFQQTFKRVLPRYFEAESRVGISLTAGLDSRMIMACLAINQEKPVSYTFAGSTQDTLDARLAGRVAKICGLEHKVLRLGSDFFSNFRSHTDRTVYITDGCVGPLAAHEIYLNRQARQLASVRVTGVFGGELLRGVSMFKPFPLASELLNPDLNRSITSLRARWTRNDQHPVTFTAFREIPEKRFGIPAASRSQLSFRTPYLDNELVALAYRAPESLRASPLLPWWVVQNNRQALSCVPTDMGVAATGSRLAGVPRQIASKAVCKLDYLYAEGLPHWLSRFDDFFDQLGSGLRLFGRHKFLHYRKWFRRELADYLNEAVKEVLSQRSPFWNPDFLNSLAREHITGQRNYVREIDAVLTLEAVDRLLLHNLSCEPKQSVPAISREQSVSI